MSEDHPPAIGRKPYRRLFWGILLGGAALPWPVGLWVWLRLEWAERPGWPDLSEPMAFVFLAILAAIGAGAPVVVAFVTRVLLTRAPTASGRPALRYRLAAGAGLLLGAGWSVYLWYGWWAQLGDVAFAFVVAPYVPVVHQLLGPLAGWGGGWLIGYGIERAGAGTME